MGAEVEQLVTAMPGRKHGENAERAPGEREGRTERPRLSVVNAVASRRREVRERVEALTVRETTGEERRSRSDNPIPGGLVSSTRYLLECADRGLEHPRVLVE